MTTHKLLTFCLISFVPACYMAPLCVYGSQLQTYYVSDGEERVLTTPSGNLPQTSPQQTAPSGDTSSSESDPSSPLTGDPSSTAKELAQAVLARVPKYDSASATMRFSDGSTMGLSEVDSSFTPGQNSGYEAAGASRNLNQLGAEAKDQLLSGNTVSAMAYQSVAVAHGNAATYNQEGVKSASNPDEPSQQTPLHGTLTFTPSIYFLPRNGNVVVVSINLQGGVGPADVHYQTMPGSLSSNLYEPSSGDLHWNAGESGLKSFPIRFDAESIHGQNMDGDEIGVEISGASGADLPAITSGRVIVPSGF